MRRIAMLMASVLLLLVVPHAFCVPPVINYQGKLTGPGGDPLGGTTVTLTFTFHDAESGGNQLSFRPPFSDTDEVVPDANGVCSTLIGDDPGNPIPPGVFWDDNVWLNVRVNGLDISPRIRMTSVGYAHQALYVPSTGTVDGVAVKTGTVSEARIDPAVTRDSELAAALGDYVKRVGSAYVVVPTTASAVQNGLNLIHAVAQAKDLAPHGQPLSATNRAAVIVPPGRYDLQASQIVMDTEFVDLIGLSTARENQQIVGDGAADEVTSGLLRQTANDVRIHNLTVECTRSGDSIWSSDEPAAYFPDAGSTATQVRNCVFRGTETGSRSMRMWVDYPGTYVDCVAGAYSFGYAAKASGTFTNCSGGFASFGACPFSTANGTFTNCTGGNESFGGHSGIASGTFINCVGGNYSFAGDDYGTASGVFTDCTGGHYAFAGGSSVGGWAGGTFTNCTAGSLAFGGGLAVGGTASGSFTDCTGGIYSYAGSQSLGGLASGTFINCRGGDFSFGSGDLAAGGSLSGLFTHCTGGTGSFGARSGWLAGARLYYCSGGADSFSLNGATGLRYCLRDGAVYP